MCPVYLGQYFSAVSHSQFIFHENICNIFVTAFKYLKIQEVDEGEWYGQVTSFKFETNTVTLLLFCQNVPNALHVPAASKHIYGENQHVLGFFFN